GPPALRRAGTAGRGGPGAGRLAGRALVAGQGPGEAARGRGARPFRHRVRPPPAPSGVARAPHEADRSRSRVLEGLPDRVRRMGQFACCGSTGDCRAAPEKRSASAQSRRTGPVSEVVIRLSNVTKTY